MDALQTIATGSSANDGTGDSLRIASRKCNTNFGIIEAAVEAIESGSLKGWLTSLAYTSVTYDSDNVISSAAVKWPDGSGGTFTRTAKNSTFLTVDAYTVTHTDSGKTVTQPAVTRNSIGQVTAQPEPTVA